MRRELWEVWKEETMAEENGMVEVQIVDVKRNTEEEEPRYVVLLQEQRGARGLPIWIGQAEATAIAFLLEGIEAPRPLTVVFAASAIRALGGKLVETRITRITERVIYATATFEGPSGRVTIDARPSDAIALALALDATIRVESSILLSPDAVGADMGASPPSDASGRREGAKEIVTMIRERRPAG
jgi:bifunctional DNase/RNase